MKRPTKKQPAPPAVQLGLFGSANAGVAEVANAPRTEAPANVGSDVAGCAGSSPAPSTRPKPGAAGSRRRKASGEPAGSGSPEVRSKSVPLPARPTTSGDPVAPGPFTAALDRALAEPIFDGGKSGTQEDSPDHASASSSVGGGHDRPGDEPEAGNVAESQSTPSGTLAVLTHPSKPYEPQTAAAWREEITERSAIREYDGGFPRDEAMRLAVHEVGPCPTGGSR